MKDIYFFPSNYLPHFSFWIHPLSLLKSSSTSSSLVALSIYIQNLATLTQETQIHQHNGRNYKLLHMWRWRMDRRSIYFFPFWISFFLTNKSFFFVILCFLLGSHCLLRWMRYGRSRTVLWCSSEYERLFFDPHFLFFSSWNSKRRMVLRELQAQC